MKDAGLDCSQRHSGELGDLGVAVPAVESQHQRVPVCIVQRANRRRHVPVTLLTQYPLQRRWRRVARIQCLHVALSPLPSRLLHRQPIGNRREQTLNGPCRTIGARFKKSYERFLCYIIRCGGAARDEQHQTDESSVMPFHKLTPRHLVTPARRRQAFPVRTQWL